MSMYMYIYIYVCSSNHALLGFPSEGFPFTSPRNLGLLSSVFVFDFSFLEGGGGSSTNSTLNPKP